MKTMPILVPAMLLLAACAPTTTDASRVPATSVTAPTPATAPPPPPSQTSPTGTSTEPATQPTDLPTVETSGASISGAIFNGNRPPPALRVCAMPVDGGTPTCIDTAQGARRYTVEVAPGGYYLLGWVQSGELRLIAHASQIRCIRAPCPPDELISVTVSVGETRAGIDLNGSYVDVPEGWPKRPD